MKSVSAARRWAKRLAIVTVVSILGWSLLHLPAPHAPLKRPGVQAPAKQQSSGQLRDTLEPELVG